MTIDRDQLVMKMAEKFHETYERLAPSHNYSTRKASAVPWADVPEENKSLMFATVSVVLDAILPTVQAETLEDFADALGVDVSDDDSDELRGYRNGQRQALRKATDRAAEYRKVASE